MALNDTLVQINLIAIYRRFLMKTAEYTFFSSTYGIDHMLSYKISLSKFKIGILSNIFSFFFNLNLFILIGG